MNTILPLSRLKLSDLPIAGGKAANLGELIRAGFKVPNGFCITTAAYRAFVDANGLAADILSLSESIDAADLNALEETSAQICARFIHGQIPAALREEILQAYTALNPYRRAVPVAVRSSATVEDLPGLSFAGQQDTYLNVLGQEELLQAVKACWGSLWTARALGYRARNSVSNRDLALAVVVQDMIASQLSGVMFTANPLTGRRLETVINAVLGLGEGLVSGQVEPDQYIVELPGKRILSKRLGDKAFSVRLQSSGGTFRQPEDARGRQALSDGQIAELAEISRQVTAHFKIPQDIEWAWADGHFHLLQSRPITTLFPLPDGVYPQNQLMVLFSFGAVQGMLDPITPLGRDVMRRLAVTIGRQFGLNVTPDTQPTFLVAAERLFVNLSGLAHHPVWRKVLRRVLPAIEPVTAVILQSVLDDPRLDGDKQHRRLRINLRLLRVFLPLGFNVLRNLLFPGYARRLLKRSIDATLERIHQRMQSSASLAERVRAVKEILYQFPLQMLGVMVPAVAAGQAAFQPLVAMAEGVADGPRLAFEITRGLPHNVTTEMDLALWETARVIVSDPQSADLFSCQTPGELARQYQAGRLPPAAQQAVSQFLQRYGARGVGEIDLGRSRWRDDPAPLLGLLADYLSIPPERSPAALFEQGARQADQAKAQLIEALRRTPGGWYKAAFARWAAPRVRELTGLRESPKFMAVRIFGILRQALDESEEGLIREGILEKSGDLYFLNFAEMTALAEGEQRDWRSLIALRRQLYEQEKQRKRVPRLLLSDGTVYYDAPAAQNEDENQVIRGSPVSPGIAEGRVRVVLDPRHAGLQPGEILVCPATDPGWTPLFLLAGGLVMEVGGMMSHGSVVAREYGIPAVVGVADATRRLVSGQRVSLDGTRGEIRLLEEE